MADQLARLNARMNAIPKNVREAVQPALDKSATELVGMQKTLAPVDEGDLQDSIRSEPGDHELQRKVIAGDDKAFYARWREFGTASQAASPFFYPAFRLLRKRLTNRIKRSIGKAVREGWAR